MPKTRGLLHHMNPANMVRANANQVVARAGNLVGLGKTKLVKAATRREAARNADLHRSADRAFGKHTLGSALSKFALGANRAAPVKSKAAKTGSAKPKKGGTGKGPGQNHSKSNGRFV